MEALTLDQIQLFLAVAQEGGFAKAARKLNRAQSAVTYGVQKLEAQIGMALFDRAAYRPALTEAGRALLVRAGRIADEARAFRETAQSLAQGLEPELTLAVDSMFPMAAVVEALKAFSARFPTVPPRVYVQPLGGSVELVLDGACMIGFLPLVISDRARLRSFPLRTVRFLPVVAPDHPLAAYAGPIEGHVLSSHVQLVLTDTTQLTSGRDYGVLSARTWRLADLGAKQAMLLAGLGWGYMPTHLVEDDIARGRLTPIHPEGFDPRVDQQIFGAAYLSDRRLGPAGQWMIAHLSGAA